MKVFPSGFLRFGALSPILLFKTQKNSSSEDVALVNEHVEEVSVVKTRRMEIVWRILSLIVLGTVGLYLCVSTFNTNSNSSGSVDPNPYTLQKQSPVSTAENETISALNTNSHLSHTTEAKNHVMMNLEKNKNNIESCPKIPEGNYSNIDSIVRHYPEPVGFDREECVCTPVNNFVILSMQRSGSGWFETLLNNHPNISSHGEIFSVRPRRENFTKIKETLDQIYNLEWLNSASKNSCTTAVGLKWMLNQGAMEYNREVANYFFENQVSIIFLLRRNLLKRLISILANAHDRKEKLIDGRHKSHVHSEEEAQKLAEFRPHLNAKHLFANLQRVQEIANDALRVFNQSRTFTVYYEEVVEDRKILDDVQQFLGVEIRTLKSKQVKIHTKPLKEQIENWDEVEKKLNGTEFETFLRDL